MVHKEYGCGLNQFDCAFNPIAPIHIRRTWNAERIFNESVQEGTENTTSYGHNLELLWLLNRAGEILGNSFDIYNEVKRGLIDHTLQFGYDKQFGGLYRDGPHHGPALVHDKEFWQNSEVLVGFLDAFEKFGDEVYLEAFIKTWEFAKTYMINQTYGEWRQLVGREGNILVGDLGNPWKAFYHTGRSIMESINRLEILTNKVG
jgi:mannose/cellobiose epimerase-like protein (N-acyl-D-glucosamine 2-epimerase family)